MKLFIMKVKLFPVYDMKVYSYFGVGVYLHLFLTQALD